MVTRKKILLPYTSLFEDGFFESFTGMNDHFVSCDEDIMFTFHNCCFPQNMQVSQPSNPLVFGLK